MGDQKLILHGCFQELLQILDSSQQHYMGNQEVKTSCLFKIQPSTHSNSSNERKIYYLDYPEPKTLKQHSRGFKFSDDEGLLPAEGKLSKNGQSVCKRDRYSINQTVDTEGSRVFAVIIPNVQKEDCESPSPTSGRENIKPSRLNAMTPAEIRQCLKSKQTAK